jgi:hypothetical protein
MTHVGDRAGLRQENKAGTNALDKGRTHAGDRARLRQEGKWRDEAKR